MQEPTVVDDVERTPRRSFLRRTTLGIAGAISLAPLSKGVLAAPPKGGNDGVDFLGLVDIPAPLAAELKIGQSHLSSLGHPVDVSHARRWLLRESGKETELLEVRALGDPHDNQRAMLGAVYSDEKWSPVQGGIQTTDSAGAVVRTDRYLLQNGVFVPSGATIREGDSFRVEKGLTPVSEKQKAALIAWELLIENKRLSALNTPAPASESLHRQCNECRNAVKLAKDLGCGYLLFTCGACCLNPFCSAALCPTCAVATYFLCIGDPGKNLGCRVCTLVRICNCPCGNYC